MAGKVEEEYVEEEYVVEVQADSSGTWSGNGLRFSTAADGAAYAKDLMARWTLVTAWRVVHVETREVSIASAQG